MACAQLGWARVCGSNTVGRIHQFSTQGGSWDEDYHRDEVEACISIVEMRAVREGEGTQGVPCR